MSTKKKNFKIYLPLILITIAVIGASIYWYIDYKKYIKTDDAYVTSDIVTISPKIMGRIAKSYVKEGDTVQQGQLVAELDSVDLLAQKHQVIASKSQTISGKIQAEAKYQYDTKSIDVLRIGVERAKEDFDRIKTQFDGGVATKEQFDHLKKAYETAQAQYGASKAQLSVSKSQIGIADAAITSSDAQINTINTQLRNTRIYAPENGIIAKRWLLTGDIASPGQSIFTLNNDSKFWINVFLEETKMGKLHAGQDVIFTLDMYPDVTFKGKIFELASTTASQFSLIPASNASGNFTKVTQRIPLKISIDGIEDGKKLSDYRLTTGMSAVVKIVK